MLNYMTEEEVKQKETNYSEVEAGSKHNVSLDLQDSCRQTNSGRNGWGKGHED